MKIPDKVYIPYEIGPDYISDCYYLGPTPKMKNAEYIRKDALLEKIDDAIAHLSDGCLTGYYESHAYNDIRELIESM